MSTPTTPTPDYGEPWKTLQPELSCHRLRTWKTLHHTMNNTPTPETDAFIFEGLIKDEWNWRHFARKLERERDAALAANADLLERLQEARESHLIATAKKVQTIQQQSVMMERLAKLLSRLKTKNWFTSGDTGEVIVALDAGEVRSALKAYELLKKSIP